MSYFARLKNWSQYPNHPKFTLNVMPQVFPLQSTPEGSNDGSDIHLSDAWYQFDKALNPATRWLTNIDSMLFDYTDHPKVAKSISCGGNVVEIDAEENGHGHLVTYENSWAPPVGDPSIIYQDNPQVIQKVTCVSKTYQIENPGANLDVYFALVADSDLWCDLSMVEKFPDLGISVSPIYPGLRLRQYPLGPVLEQLPAGQPLTLISYDPRGSDVWAKVQLADGSRGYVALMYNGVFYTTWKMATQPPLRPAGG
jgi:hypothetical protein